MGKAEWLNGETFWLFCMSALDNATESCHTKETHKQNQPTEKIPQQTPTNLYLR